MAAQQEAFDALNRPGIRYEVVRHPAAGTIAEIAGMGILEHGEIPGSQLSFASEARMERYPGLHQGSVTAGVR